MTEPPLVTVVMPSFNQARFLREAVDSVLAQDYPRLEVWVMDGGSTDGSVDILRSYAERIRFESGPDRGQADAINQGFARARGSIVAWLNSDDVYLSGAVRTAVAALSADPAAAMVYGEGEIIDESGRVLGPFIHTRPFDLWILVHASDFILQPTVFMRAAALRAAGGLDESLHFGLDWELWMRLACQGPVLHVPRALARAREHAATKTAQGGWRRLAELSAIMRRHGAWRWPPGLRAYGLDTLRRELPAIFGPSSLADAERLRGRVVARALRPIHDAMTHLVARQTMPYPGVWSDGWMGERAFQALGWSGQEGMAVVEVEVPSFPHALPFRLEATVEGKRVVATSSVPGPLTVTVPVAAGRGPRPLEVRLRASPSWTIPGDARRLTGLLRRLSFVPRREAARV
jgi:GT2 family glycosyltransferase